MGEGASPLRIPVTDGFGEFRLMFGPTMPGAAINQTVHFHVYATYYVDWDGCAFYGQRSVYVSPDEQDGCTAEDFKYQSRKGPFWNSSEEARTDPSMLPS
jgi:hypothetical protein